jgi:hypothetical protein
MQREKDTFDVNKIHRFSYSLKTLATELWLSTLVSLSSLARVFHDLRNGQFRWDSAGTFIPILLVVTIFLVLFMSFSTIEVSAEGISAGCLGLIWRTTRWQNVRFIKRRRVFGDLTAKTELKSEDYCICFGKNKNMPIRFSSKIINLDELIRLIECHTAMNCLTLFSIDTGVFQFAPKRLWMKVPAFDKTAQA